MSVNDPTYPQESNSVRRRLGNFWTDQIGRTANPDNIVDLGNRLFFSPHLPLEMSYQRELRPDVKGEISSAAVRKILGDQIEQTGLEKPRVQARLTEVSAEPEAYDAELRVTDGDDTNAVGEALDFHSEGYLLFDRVPRDMDLSSDYEFNVTGVRGYEPSGGPGVGVGDKEEYDIF